MISPKTKKRKDHSDSSMTRPKKLFKINTWIPFQYITRENVKSENSLSKSLQTKEKKKQQCQNIHYKENSRYLPNKCWLSYTIKTQYRILFKVYTLYKIFPIYSHKNKSKRKKKGIFTVTIAIP